MNPKAPKSSILVCSGGCSPPIGLPWPCPLGPADGFGPNMPKFQSGGGLLESAGDFEGAAGGGFVVSSGFACLSPSDLADVGGDLENLKEECAESKALH